MADHTHHVTKHWLDSETFEGWLWLCVFVVFFLGMALAVFKL